LAPVSKPLLIPIIGPGLRLTISPPNGISSTTKPTTNILIFPPPPAPSASSPILFLFFLFYIYFSNYRLPITDYQLPFLSCQFSSPTSLAFPSSSPLSTSFSSPPSF